MSNFCRLTKAGTFSFLAFFPRRFRSSCYLHLSKHWLGAVSYRKTCRPRLKAGKDARDRCCALVMLECHSRCRISWTAHFADASLDSSRQDDCHSGGIESATTAGRLLPKTPTLECMNDMLSRGIGRTLPAGRAKMLSRGQDAKVEGRRMPRHVKSNIEYCMLMDDEVNEARRVSR